LVREVGVRTYDVREELVASAIGAESNCNCAQILNGIHSVKVDEGRVPLLLVFALELINEHCDRVELIGIDHDLN